MCQTSLVVNPSTSPVTFLFTDIEGSTRRWEADPAGMNASLIDHDAVLRGAIEGNDGHVFKHTGDGIAAAFRSARSAVQAAIEAQRALSLPVRMGIASGEVEQRDGDYFGATVNRVARVMGAGHGGQILVTAAVATSVTNVDFVDLGMHHLRDLSEAVQIFQVVADGLTASFPPLATLLAQLGNLVIQPTSFVGRDAEVNELTRVVLKHRMVTLTGAGGVGKTRLAARVAGALAAEFPGGVWLVELAPVRDPAAVEDVVAGTLGTAPRPDVTLVVALTQAIGSRRMLIVLDNCEHVLDKAADLVETLLARCPNLAFLATSREGLQVAAEQLWPVPPLKVDSGIDSEAVTLFVERARAVNPHFELADAADIDAVTAICRGLDGLAHAIELAAARTMSMSPQDLLRRLGDRFRLLSGSNRGLGHHQTLRSTVAWSYDLLNNDERHVMSVCSVFADGFDPAAVTHLCADDAWDEYRVLDLLDALVRKSLLTTRRVDGATRYGCLETIRQFAEEQLLSSGGIEVVRQRHAAYFAAEAVAQWQTWNSPRQRSAIDWVDLEFANLRAGFRWSADHHELAYAVTIAAHAAMLSFILQLFEPVGWVEEIVPAAREADVAELPRLLTAASICALTGRPHEAIEHAHEAQRLETDPKYRPFEPGWSDWWELCGYRYAGPIEHTVELGRVLADRDGFPGVVGLGFMIAVLPGLGRSDEARAVADRAVAAARALGVPFFIAFATGGYGRAYIDVDRAVAMRWLTLSLEHARDHRNVYQEKAMERDIAGLVATLGDPERALELFDNSVSFFHRAGNRASVSTTLADIAVVLDRIGRFSASATVYGTGIRLGTSMVAELPQVLDHLRAVLGNDAFEGCVQTGEALEFDAAMRYVRDEIAQARHELTGAG